MIPSQFIYEDGTVYEKVLGVLDFVSGMTDNFATDLYRKIKGIDIGMTMWFSCKVDESLSRKFDYWKLMLNKWKGKNSNSFYKLATSRFHDFTTSQLHDFTISRV